MHVKIHLEDGSIEKHEDVRLVGLGEATGWVVVEFDEPKGDMIYYRKDLIRKITVRGAGGCGE